MDNLNFSKITQQTTFSILPKQKVFDMYMDAFADETIEDGTVYEKTGVIGLRILTHMLWDFDTIAFNMFDTYNTDFAPDAKVIKIDNQILESVKCHTVYETQHLKLPVYHSLRVGQIPLTHQQPDTPIYEFSINGSWASSALTDTIIPWDLTK